MKKTSILLACLLTTTFVIVAWNLIISISSSQNRDFLSYLKYVFLDKYEEEAFVQKYIHEPIIEPASGFLDDLSADKNTRQFVYGQRDIHEDKLHYVTLTFYVEYGNHQHMQDLISMLHQYKVNKGVFFVEKNYMEDHSFVIDTLKHNGFVVDIWKNLEEYDKNYPPSVFYGIALSDRDVLNFTHRDYIASSLYDVALHYENSSIVAFNPKIMTHKDILERILKHNGKSIVFTDSNITSAKNVYNSDYGKGSSLVGDLSSKGTPIRIKDGIWSLSDLKEKYSWAISDMSSGGYLITNPFVIESGAELNTSNDKVFLQSATDKNNTPAYLEIRGKAKIYNSTITSWDPVIRDSDPNPYHPRPYILVLEGGKVDVLNSAITHLGYSLGGINDTRFARSALAYYDTNNFIVANSTIAYNYYGFYSANSSNFQIVNNKVFGQTRYGLDPHTWSRDFVVDSNYVHDNGNQGIICSLYCSNVTITNNIVEYNVEGIGLHWLTNSSIIKDNIVRYNEKFGIFIQKNSYDNLIQNNTVIGNAAGIGILESSSGNTITENTISDNVVAIRMEPDSLSNTEKNNKYTLDEDQKYLRGEN